MGRPNLYLAVYDVTLDRERNRVAKVLEGFGMRIQLSAFEVSLDTGARATLLRRLEELRIGTGWVALYRLAVGQKRAVVGKAPANPLDEDKPAWILTDVTLGPGEPDESRRLPPPEPTPLGTNVGDSIAAKMEGETRP